MRALDVLVAIGLPVLFFATGLALVALVPRSAAIRPRALRLGIAYPLGLAWTAGLAYAASHLLGLAIGRKLTLGLALLPILVLLALRRERVSLRAQLPRRPVAIALLAGGTLVTTALLFDALTNPITDWDGRMTWGAQAKYVAEARSVDLPVLREARWWVAHPQYPLLLPVAQSMALALAGGVDERVVRPLYVAFFPSLLLILWGVARRWGRAAAAFASGQALIAPFVAFFSHGGASGGCSDLPIACMVGGSLALLCRAGSSPATGALAGILLAGAVLAKNEGLYLALVVLGAAVASAAAASRERGRLFRSLLVPAGFVLAATLVLVHWRAGIPNRWDEKYPAPGLAVLRAAAARLSEVAPRVFGLTARTEEWGWLWRVAPLLLVTGLPALRRRVLLPWAAALLGSVALYLIAYGSSPWPTKLIVDTTWHRFLEQMLVPLLAIVSAAFAETMRAARRGGDRS